MYLLFTSEHLEAEGRPNSTRATSSRTPGGSRKRQGITGEDRAWIASPLFYRVSAMQGPVRGADPQRPHRAPGGLRPPGGRSGCSRSSSAVYYGFGSLTRKLLAVPGFDKSRIALRKGMIGFSVEDRRLALDELGVADGCSVYGMTETYGLFALTRHDDPREIVLTSQGFALPGNEPRIVDPATGLPLPPGRSVTCNCAAASPAATSTTTAHPRVLYATGSSAPATKRVDDASRLVYHSRAVDTMKPGGISRGPQEVEALLDEVPGIAQAHVCAIPDPADGERVVAFIEGTRRHRPGLHRRPPAWPCRVLQDPRRFIYRRDADLPKLPQARDPAPDARARPRSARPAQDRTASA